MQIEVIVMYETNAAAVHIKKNSRSVPTECMRRISNAVEVSKTIAIMGA